MSGKRLSIFAGLRHLHPLRGEGQICIAHAYTRGALSMQSQEATKLSHIVSLKTFAQLLVKKDFQQ